MGGAGEVLSQEDPGRAEAAQQEGVLRALLRSSLAPRSTKRFGWKVMNTLCPAASPRSRCWALQRWSWYVSAACPPHYPCSPGLWSGPLPGQTVISFGELAATCYELDSTVYVPVPSTHYFTTKQSAHFCESLSPLLNSELLFI